jgi:hypothetical protein
LETVLKPLTAIKHQHPRHFPIISLSSRLEYSSFIIHHLSFKYMSELAKKLIEKEKQERTGTLDLGNCGLTEWPDLRELYWLETLILSSEWWEFDLGKNNWTSFKTKNKGDKNQFKSSPTYALPSGLIKLMAVELDISDMQFLRNLTSLHYLDIRENPIVNIHFLANLTSLKTLNLWGNHIADIHFLESLSSLQFLNLTFNEKAKIHFLKNLTNLQTLNLSSNEIADIRSLENLTNLQFIDLSFNTVADIQFLANLSSLQHLKLFSNKIADIRSLENLTNLQFLDLSYNQIADIRFLEKLTSLQSLNLSTNEISDIRFLKNLTNLQKLDLSNNQITDIFPILPLIEKGVLVTTGNYGDGINLFGNPLTNPPPEIVEQGNAAILEYFRQKAATGAEPLLEAKLILLGDGRSGKTSLACRLLQKPLPKEADRTEGVDIIIGD